MLRMAREVFHMTSGHNLVGYVAEDFGDVEPAALHLTVILHAVTPFIHPCKKNKNKTDQLMKKLPKKKTKMMSWLLLLPTAFGDKSQNRTMVAMCEC